MNEYLTTEEVAAPCRTTPETVRYWRHIGSGPRSFKVGRRVLYLKADVEQWLEDARANGAPGIGPSEGTLRVIALHHAGAGWLCDHCRHPCPCPTIRALKG